MTVAVDLFAGPGGWDVGARELGIDPLGIEWDDAACRVREAAGLRTLQADVAALDPLDFPCDLLIASPPCTAFSMAGKGEGRKAIDALLACVHRMGDGEVIDQAELDEACSDETAHLVLEPLRWALALKPSVMCCEQVPPVLPLWEAMASVLQRHGWMTWTGILSAEQYGMVATCPEHDPRPVHIAGLPSCPTSLATADPAATPWAEWLVSAEAAERRSTFSTSLASVHRAGTGTDIGATLTGALSDAWTVASLGRAVLDAASDATWQSLVLDLLQRALPAPRTQRGRAVAEWTNAAMSESGWSGATGANIVWSPSNFWAELCALAKSYTTSMATSPTTTRATSGCSSRTATTRITTTRARSRAECSLCSDFATPQTRKRAFLIADRDRLPNAPAPTHQRYVLPRNRDDEGGGLFDLPDPERVVAKGEEHLEPWVSMAEALGWTDGPVPAPAPTVTSGGTAAGGVEVFASRGARERVERSVVLVNPYDRPNSAERSVDDAAPTVLGGNDFEERVWKVPAALDRRQTGGDGTPVITEKARSAEWAYGVSVAGKRPRTRPITEPAPSITGAGAGGLDEWVPAGLDRRQTSGRGEVVPVVPLDRPAPTMTVTGLASGRDVWVGKRPATTVAGDPRISHPGGHTANDGRDNSRMVGRTEGAVRVTIEQAACLQGFPDNYPWQAAGSRSAAFRCIGNAVPPPLARAVMAEALASSRGQVAA